MDFWNNPPDDEEPPECCGEYMEIDDSTGVATCPTCHRRIEPADDLEPVLQELPDNLPLT